MPPTHIQTMQEHKSINDFCNAHNNHIAKHETLSNGVTRIVFSSPEKVMWLKGLIQEKLGLVPITHTYMRDKTVYYFE